MATEQRPLFNRHLLSARMSGFEASLSFDAQEALNDWVRAASEGTLTGKTEKSLQGQFLSDIFGKVLGYGRSVGRQHFHLRAEKGSNLRGAGTPDGTLGFYQNEGAGETRVVIELKGPGANLDARQPGYGNITPVEQAFRYVTQFDDCRWVIVSNFETVRLYSKTRGQGHWHEFRMADLGKPEILLQFLFLLSRDCLIAEGGGQSLVDALAAETHVQEQDITKKFYGFYKEVRGRIFRGLVTGNPPPPSRTQADHEVFLLEKTQKLLDRLLFACFCEDTGLLPPNVIRKALEATTVGFVAVSRWQQLCGLFNAIDKGHKPLGIPGYNGGLFAHDAELEALSVGDQVLDDFLALSAYDFATDLNVNILGHVFEQSINDLEVLRAEIQGSKEDAKGGKRKKEGVFYTPEYITQFIVENTVGSWLAERFEEVRAKHDPDGVDSRKKEERRKKELAMWLEYQDVLRHIKVLDPACGSGAFLVAAFDFLLKEFRRVNEAVASFEKEKNPGAGLFDLDRQILQQNLYGVDINPESVEITKLSLWLKTARKDRPLSNLDGNIKCGNSIVAPPGTGATSAQVAAFEALPAEIRGRAFSWESEFPTVFSSGRTGFNCVIGNPPYVRQELLAPIKPHLQGNYAAWHGMADLFVYFYERGVLLLAPGGKLSYIVTNKWLRSGYGEALRGFLAKSGVLESIVDFGHAPIFEDADTFPCIITYRRAPETSEAEGEARSQESVVVCPMPRNALGQIGVRSYVSTNSFRVHRSRFGSAPWSLEDPLSESLVTKIRSKGIPMGQYAGTKHRRGLVTGCNEAFIVATSVRDSLISEDSRSAELLVPLYRGQDLGRWWSDWQGLWLILLGSSAGQDWPWRHAKDGAEEVFGREFPAIHRRLKAFEQILRPRTDQGVFWWELRSCDYYDEFRSPKLMYQEIQFLPRYSFDRIGSFGTNKVFFIPTDDLYLLAVLNSPLMWWHNWRYLPHMKDEALSPVAFLMEKLPIAEPNDRIREAVVPAVQKLIELTRASSASGSELLDWLRMEHGIETPGQKLEDFASLDSDGFVQEVKKRMPKDSRLSPALLAELRASFEEHAVPMRQRKGEALVLERRLSDLVNEAYGLTPEEVDLMWKTAPPRMPVGR